MLTRDDVNRRLASLPASQETPADYRYAAEREALETALALWEVAEAAKEYRAVVQAWYDKTPVPHSSSIHDAVIRLDVALAAVEVPE
jgi:hypothetical protein